MEAAGVTMEKCNYVIEKAGSSTESKKGKKDSFTIMGIMV